MPSYPKVVYKEEGMREGMQIEDSNISVDDKIELLDQLSDTGLKNIVVGSFVSPKWTPQMERIDEIVTRFTPKPGVTYTALALNSRGVERARAYSPPLTIERDPYPRLSCHMCDVFTRRNTNRSQMQEMETWPQRVAQAQELNVKEAGIGCNASWGSNFLGEFPVDNLMTLLEKEHAMWDEVGINVRSVSMGDPMSHCTPAKVEESLYRVKERWPEIDHIRLHLHNGRNMAIASAYAAMRTLGPDDTLELDGTIGGFGGLSLLRQRPRHRHGPVGGPAPHDGGHGHRDRRGHRQAGRLCLDRRAHHRSRPVRPCIQGWPPGPGPLINSTTLTPRSSRPWMRPSTSRRGPRYTRAASIPTASLSPAPTATGSSRAFRPSIPPRETSLGSRTGSPPKRTNSVP